MSYAWDAPCLVVVKQLVSSIHPRDPTAAEEGDEAEAFQHSPSRSFTERTAKGKRAVYVWLDIFALSQFRDNINDPADLETVRLALGRSSKGGASFFTSFMILIPLSSTGSMLVIDPAFKCLTRTW